MKTKSIILSLVASMMLGMSLTSCKDMLSSDSERHSYDVAGDTLYSYWGILKSLQNVAERYVILGECRGDLVDGTTYTSDTIKPILDFDMAKATDGSCRYLQARDYYHVINSCNAYLASVDSTRTTGTLQPYMMKEFAQVEAIRAWVYMQLVQVYGEVPFYTQPLLSTDAINDVANNANTQKANVDNLADLLEPYLARALDIELEYGLPDYSSYGYTTTVCHSTKAMIPLDLVLGDLYLMKGDKGSCTKAAQYYYNYLANNNYKTNKPDNGKLPAGGPLPAGYDFQAFQSESMDKPNYSKWTSTTTVFTETGAQSSTKESITAIPSSTNKLWGNVLRGVNELFGYDSEISVSTGQEDSTTYASISLNAQYDKKQLQASQGYFNLCKAQKYEVLIGDEDAHHVEIDPNVGDARQYWVQDQRQTYSNGTSNTEKFVTKQNPGGAFTTVYPMIYRKSQVWLRFAEAINRAGYPSYAFAVLKDGHCNNYMWYPDTQYGDYDVKDSAIVVEYNDNGTKFFPVVEHTKDSPYRTSAECLAAALASGIPMDSIEMINDTVPAFYYAALSYQNYCSESSDVQLNYLDRREVEKAPTFLNFTSGDVFQGNYSTFSVPYRSLIRGAVSGSFSDPSESSTSVYYTQGIHARGCGQLGVNYRSESSYDYVGLLQEKYLEETGKEITKEEIYSGDYDEKVQNYVEDLIVDEEALELAFEGDRFFDLMRVAHRRGDASYLAKKVANRTGSFDSGLYSKLLSTKNWYFPLPNK